MTTSLGRFHLIFSGRKEMAVFFTRVGLFQAFIVEALESEACVSGITVCGQLEVRKFWSVLTKKNKLEELQINTHVGDFPYVLPASSALL